MTGAESDENIYWPGLERTVDRTHTNRQYKTNGGNIQY